MAEQVARTNAAIGVLAPENTHLEIKGAWLTPNNREWRDPGKAQRKKFATMELHKGGSSHNNRFEADRFSRRKTPGKPAAQPGR